MRPEEEAPGMVDALGSEVTVLSAAGRRFEADSVEDVKSDEPVISGLEGRPLEVADASLVGAEVMEEVPVTNGTVMGTPAELQMETTADETAVCVCLS